jgi:subtilisin-like proprotein convertase family protein
MMQALRLSAISTVVAAAWALAPAAHAQCVTGGPGGFIPAPGAIDGTWPSVLPTGELTSPLNVTVPAGATVIHSVKVQLQHTWSGDLQIVLEAPNGSRYNVLQTNDGIFGGGCFTQFFGAYEFVDPIGGSGCGTTPSLGCGVNKYPPGTYVQEWGAWPAQSAGIDNVALEQIPIANGTWKLILYDWYVGFDHGSLLSWDLCFGNPSPPPPPPVNTMNCVPGGAGGAFPVSGVDGTWPTVMPTGELHAPLNVVVPPGSTKIVGIKLNDIVHTWYGDIQFVLQSPSGQLYNILQTVDGVFGGGCGDDLNGDYVIVDANVGQSPCGGPAQTWPCQYTTVPEDTFFQNWSQWPDGTNNIFNVPIEQIPIASGTWTLICYDWYVLADDGSFPSWELCFDGTSGPSTYCPPQAPGSTNGCLPTIAATGNPNVAHSNSCVITVSGVEGQKTGIVFYGITGTTSSPWCFGGNSFLCVKAPTQRTNAQPTGGTSGACDGSLSLDWNSYQLANPTVLGNPWSSGQHAYVQGWFRDPPACKTTFLSEALDMTYIP